MIRTYGAKNTDGTVTYGGYSDIMVADEHFIVRIPENMPLDATAPLLCAGITVYSPLKFYGLDKPGMHIGVVGLGGLGHMAVKFSKAMGLKVTVVSTSPNKKDEAIKNLGADSFLVSRDQNQMKEAMGTMDGIIDTVSAMHPIEPLLGLLKANGKLVLVGAPEKPLELPAFSLLGQRKMVGRSYIGGMEETQEVLDFAQKHSIKAEIELIPVDYVNIALERISESDVSFRFVIDIAKTLSQGLTLLLLNIPEELASFGIDNQDFSVDTSFKGIKNIPPGPHFLHYCYTCGSGKECSPRIGFFIDGAPSEVIVLKWDEQQNRLVKEEDTVKSLDDSHLDPYDWAHYREWKTLSDYITKDVIKQRGSIRLTDF